MKKGDWSFMGCQKQVSPGQQCPAPTVVGSDNCEKHQPRRCSALKKSGDPCTAQAVFGWLYCRSHGRRLGL